MEPLIRIFVDRNVDVRLVFRLKTAPQLLLQVDIIIFLLPHNRILVITKPINNGTIHTYNTGDSLSLSKDGYVTIKNTTITTTITTTTGTLYPIGVIFDTHKRVLKNWLHTLIEDINKQKEFRQLVWGLS